MLRQNEQQSERLLPFYRHQDFRAAILGEASISPHLLSPQRKSEFDEYPVA
jgi:hypothetical protein